MTEPSSRAAVTELASLLAAGILRLQARAALSSDESPESADTCLEVPAPSPLSVTTTGVNRGETNPRSDVCN